MGPQWTPMEMSWRSHDTGEVDMTHFMRVQVLRWVFMGWDFIATPGAWPFMAVNAGFNDMALA